jgi:iron complex outermembrane receptor protein
MKMDNACGAEGLFRRGQRSSAILRTALFLFVVLPVFAQEQAADLTNRSIEDLMNIQVTSVSKREETLSRTAASVFVITQ